MVIALFVFIILLLVFGIYLLISKDLLKDVIIVVVGTLILLSIEFACCTLLKKVFPRFLYKIKVYKIAELKQSTNKVKMRFDFDNKNQKQKLAEYYYENEDYHNAALAYSAAFSDKSFYPEAQQIFNYAYSVEKTEGLTDRVLDLYEAAVYKYSKKKMTLYELFKINEYAYAHKQLCNSKRLHSHEKRSTKLSCIGYKKIISSIVPSEEALSMTPLAEIYYEKNDFKNAEYEYALRVFRRKYTPDDLYKIAYCEEQAENIKMYSELNYLAFLYECDKKRNAVYSTEYYDNAVKKVSKKYPGYKKFLKADHKKIIQGFWWQVGLAKYHYDGEEFEKALAEEREIKKQDQKVVYTNKFKNILNLDFNPLEDSQVVKKAVLKIVVLFIVFSAVAVFPSYLFDLDIKTRVFKIFLEILGGACAVFYLFFIFKLLTALFYAWVICFS